MSSAIEPARPRDLVSARLILISVALLAYEVLAHRVTASGTQPWLTRLLAFAPLVLVSVWVIWRRRNLLDCLVLSGAVCIALAMAQWVNPGALRALPHVTLCLFVASLFARTLLPGKVALVTRLARHVHGDLPAVIESYTRRVTWAWFLFMTGLALTSLLLSCLFAPEDWSVFANLFTLPLVMLLFALEYIYRVRRFPWFEHVSPLAAMRVFRTVAVRDTQL
jgi:uncharacterized membrane protein